MDESSTTDRPFKHDRWAGLQDEATEKKYRMMDITLHARVPEDHMTTGWVHSLLAMCSHLDYDLEIEKTTRDDRY